MRKPSEPLACLVTKELCLPEEMLRFVVAPDGWLMHDITGKLPGEACYVYAQPDLLTEAIERQLFKRAFRKPLQIPEQFEQQVREHLYKRVLDGVSMARKGGCAVNGFDKCHQAMQSDQVLVMLHAADASMDGVRKLSPSDQPFEISKLFSRDALSVAIGVGNVVHVAILKGKASAFFLKQLRRFTLFIEKTPL